MSKKHAVKLILLIASLIVLAAAGMTLAYFTDTETADNTFEIGDVKLQINEPNYPQDKKDRILTVNQTMPKDPMVENIGTNDEVVYLAVTVPLENVTMINEDKQLDGDRKYQEIIKFSVGEGKESSVVTDNSDFCYNSSWKYLKMTEDISEHTRTYYFGFSKVLEVKSATPALFDRIQIKSFLEGQMNADITTAIDLYAYGIQSDEISGYDLSKGSVTKEQLSDILKIYINQNGGV